MKYFNTWQANVMPHPPLRSRPTSAGATKARPSSAGRERTAVPPVTRGEEVERMWLKQINRPDFVPFNQLCLSKMRENMFK